MKVLDFGSLNIDYTYEVAHITQAGETQTSRSRTIFCGGKGLNQAIALAKAGSDVYLAGLIGDEGQMLVDAAAEAGVRTDFIKKMPGCATGHTIIQVDDDANNCITLFAGTNRMVDHDFVDDVLSHFEAGDVLLLQNEVSSLDYIIDSAAAKGMMIVLNPSPYDYRLDACDLSKVNLFLINEVEGYQITGEKEPQAILDMLMKNYPEAKVVLTLGGDGSCYRDAAQYYQQAIFPVQAVDTTSAGDTFTGYFVTLLLEGAAVSECLRTASMASSISVSRPGASASIPLRAEVETALAQA